MNLVESLARWAWESSLAASLLAVIAIVARFILRKPVFTPIRYMLGLLMVARLLMPFSVSSPFSVFNLFQPQQKERLAPAPPSGEIKTTTLEISVSAPPPVIFREQFPALPILWIVACAAILTRVFVQQLRVRRSIKGATQILTGSLFDAMEEAREIMACRRTIRLYSIRGLSSPALSGIFRPVILLPTEFAASATQMKLRLVYLHEIAHLRRFDVPINWLMIFAQAIHWFNPLVWLTMRRLRAEQELLCDGDVMRILRPEEHHTYGETLLALASPCNAAPSTLIPISSSFKQLKERIAMITQFKPATSRLLLFALPILAALIAIVTFTGATDRRPPKPPTVAEKSKTTEAAEQRALGLDRLERELAEQNARLGQAEASVDSLRRALGLPPYSDESELFSSESEDIKHIQMDLVRAKQEYLQYEVLEQKLKSKARPELVQALPTAYHDEALDRLLQSLATAQQQLASAKIDFSDDHPEVRKAQTMTKTVQEQIEQRTDGILNGLDALVSSREAIVKELTVQLSEAKDHQSSDLERARPYFKALRDLESQRKIRETLLMRFLQERVDSQLSSR